MGLIAGAIGVGVLGAGMSAYAASQQSSAEASAAQQQNQANIDEGLWGRGAPLEGQFVPQDMKGAQAAVLPYYFGGQETAMAGDATSIYNALKAYYGSPQNQLNLYQSILNGYQPSLSAADQLAADIANGNVTSQMLSEEQPVAQATLAEAQGTKSAAMEALAETLGQIDAIQAGKGYSGDSLGDRMLKFQATRTANQQGAAAINSANLSNAQAKQGIQQQGRALRIQNIGLPDTMARSALARTTLPSTMTTANYNNSLQPFSFYRMGQAQYQPVSVPATAGTGQIIGQAMGSLGSAASNYMLQSQLQNQAWNSYNTSLNNSLAQQSAWGYAGSAANPAASYGTGYASSGLTPVDLEPIPVGGP